MALNSNGHLFQALPDVVVSVSLVSSSDGGTKSGVRIHIILLAETERLIYVQGEIFFRKPRTIITF